MSLPHRNPLDSLPSLRVRIGEALVDVPLREIVRADGSRTRITVKSLEVLMVLAMQPGQVVSRDVLLQQVWPSTMPTNDVVTQAVVGLRKAFGSAHGNPKYLETIPKSGYRLLAAVEWLPDAAATAPVEAGTMAASPPPARRRGTSRLLLAGTAGLALLALAWLLIRGSRNEEPPATVPVASELKYVLLTSQLGPETQPALSPDGAMLAYAMPAGAPDNEPAIFVQATQPAAPRQLTFPPDGHSDHLPRWSPDGRLLMYVRIDAKRGCELQLLPVSGGSVRTVGRCDRINGRYDWLPDGNGIVAGLKPEPGEHATPLSTLRLDSGQWQAMDYAITAGDVDFDPRFSPDGRQLAFRRNLSHSDLWAMPTGGGTPTQLTRLRGGINGWDWTPDGRALLFARPGSPPQLYRHDLASGSSHAVGEFTGHALDVATHANNMVFATDDLHMAMFRYPLPLGEGTRAEPLFASTGRNALPSPSPDGRWVAFYSDRSRETRLWLGEPGEPTHLRMIDGLVPVFRHPAQWSDDGRRLLVIGESATTEGTAQPTLYEIDVASGRVTVLPMADIPYFAQYLPGNRMLLVVDRGEGRLALRIVANPAKPDAIDAEMDDVGEARFDPASGAIHFVRASGPGLWRVGLDLQSPTRLDSAQPTAYWMRRWAVQAGRPFVLPTAAPTCLAQWQWLGDGPAVDGGCVDRQLRGLPALAPVVSRDGKWLYATMVPAHESSDIGLIDLDALAGPEPGRE